MISLTALCNAFLLNPKESIRACAAAYLLHLSALRRSSLSQRSCREAALDTREQEHLDEFFALFADVCISVVESIPVHERWDAFDLLDGRVMRQIFKNMGSLASPPSITGEAHKFAERICQLTKVDISEFIPSRSADKVAKKPSQAVSQTDRRPNLSALPFAHPVLDEFLEPIRLVTDDSLETVGKPKVFQELSHWHNAKTPIDPKQESRRPKGFHAHRRNQRWMADMIAYSASLTNASGKSINPETIVVRSDATTVPVKSDKKARPAEGKTAKQVVHQPRAKNKKHPVKGGRESALAEAQRVRGEKSDNKLDAVMTFWDERCREIQAERNLVRRFLKTEKYLNGLSKEDRAAVGAEVSLYICNVLASLILEEKRRGGGPSGKPSRVVPEIVDRGVCSNTDACTTEMSLFAMMWWRAIEIANMQLSSQGLSQLQSFFKTLRIPLAVTAASGSARTLPFQNILAASTTQPEISLQPFEFQLKHCGPYLERSFDPSTDQRVPNFRPDAWQRRVLDAIDDDKSLFVVAPTSAGKTFISFYAMKKVLQSSDEGVLVYVAPTKALVNQIAAEIQARFSKSYSSTGRSVWAIHTRDYRINNPTGCQILVTVPDILQIMLLAPSNAEKATSWSRRVRRIIFDEVHCIGQADDGMIWEQLLLLAPCPIIALSATIGNPLELKAWLEESEKSKGVELEMIVHSSRYSDLRKFTYNPLIDTYTFRGLVPAEGLQIPGLDEGEGGPSPFSFIHPIVGLVNRYSPSTNALTLYAVLIRVPSDRATLQDVTLEPRDCLALWRCMSKHQTKSHPVNDALNPSRVFPAIAKKPDVVGWERALKEIVEAWMQDPKSPFAAVRSELGSAFFQPKPPSHPSQEGTSTDSKEFGVTFEIDKDVIESTALPLLTDLHRRGALPAILFDYDRDHCEKTLRTLQEQLTRAENSWKDSSPDWKKKLAEYERWKKTNSQKDKMASAAKSRPREEPELSKIDLMRESSTEASKWESFDPDAPLDAFSFANRTAMLGSELASLVKRLSDANQDPVIVGALRRGIAVHHAGMNRGYRQT